jgi:hypothetical protein
MRLIICEGRHAVAALTSILESAFSCCRVRGGPTPNWYRPPRGSGQTIRELQAQSSEQIFVHGLAGKPNLFEAFKLRLASQFIQDTTMIAINFDPNGQSESQWRQAIESRFPPDCKVARNGWNYGLVVENAPVTIVPVPWLAPSTSLSAGFQDTQSLYRTISSSLEAALPEKNNLITSWLNEAASAGPAVDWKALCWYWMAAWFPNDECEFFFERVMSLGPIHQLLSSAPTSAQFWTSMQELAR